MTQQETSMEFDLAIDTPEPESVEVEQTEPIEQEEHAEETTNEPVAAESAEEAKLDYRKVPAEHRELLKNPANKRLADAWHERGAFRERFPGGPKDADAVLSFLNEKGGQESISTTLGELEADRTELQEINRAISQGDSKIIDKFIEASPQGFAKIAPDITARWAQVDPQGYNHRMTQVVASTLTSENESGDSVRSVIRDAMRSGSLEEVRTLLGTLNGWVNGIVSTSKTAPQSSTQGQPATQISEREQNVQKEEQRIFTSDVSRDVESQRKPVIETELKSFIDRRPKDTDARDLAVATVRQQVIERLAADTAFQTNLNNLLARKDKAGMLRLIASKEKSAIQDIAPKVGRAIFGNPGPVKTAAPARTQRTPPVDALDPKTKFLREMLSA